MKLSGNEIIRLSDNLRVVDFWSWAYSDILSNRNRGIFAEFLVASALGVTHSSRVEWDAFDLTYGGKTIEVKSSAYLQSWQQNSLSRMRFDIGKKKSWFASTNTYADQQCRSADGYVFCAYIETEMEKANILDLTKWEFYVLSTHRINSGFKDQKSIAYGQLQNFCKKLSYENLKIAINYELEISAG